MNKAALMAVVVLSGNVQVDIAGKTYTLTGGNRDVFAQDGERQLATLDDANLPPAKYEVPTGAYKVFNLVMESEPDRNGNIRKVDLRLTARDNRIVQSYVSHDLFAPQLEGLKYDGNKLTGVYIVGGSEGVNPRTAYTLGLTVAADGKVAGNYSSKTVLLAVNPTANGKDGLSGTITGEVVTEDQMAESEALDKTKNWPQSSGPMGNWHAAPFDAPILDDLNQARLVWRSEQMIGHGPGTACRRINQGRNTTCYTFTAGSAQPVVSDGKVYFSYWEPSPGYYSPRITEDTEVGYHCGKWANVEKYYGKFWADKERRHWGGNAHGGGIADDHVVCIDGATGKTLWHTVLPFRAWNFWDHKTAPTGLTPAIVDGTIGAMGSGHFIYGLEARTGKVLWEKGEYAARPHDVWRVKGMVTSNIDILKRARAKDPDLFAFTPESKTNPPERNMPRLWYEDGMQMAAFGGVFIATDFFGNYIALDPATGKKLWEHPLGPGGGVRAPVGLTIEGQEMVFMPSSGKAVDPKTGNELWNAKQTFHRASVSGDKIVCDGDDMTLTVFKAGNDQVQKLWSRPISSKHYVVSFITRDYIFANVESNQVVVLDAKDGTELWRQSKMIYNNPGWSAVKDRVLLHLDSAHASRTQQYVYTNAGKDTKQVCKWDPPVNPTNPYNRPPGGFWTSVVVDGRIFVRGSDGIYCYDIRKT